MSNPAENFCKSLFKPNWGQCCIVRSQMVQTRTAANFFYAFGIKERTKGRLYEGKRKQGIDWIKEEFLWITI